MCISLVYSAELKREDAVKYGTYGNNKLPNSPKHLIFQKLNTKYSGAC